LIELFKLPLFVSAGHLIAPLAAHVICNFMGLPAVYANRKGTTNFFTFYNFLDLEVYCYQQPGLM
jgi:hypothetical protein